jgi:hypothetical protein
MLQEAEIRHPGVVVMQTDYQTGYDVGRGHGFSEGYGHGERAGYQAGYRDALRKTLDMLLVARFGSDGIKTRLSLDPLQEPGELSEVLEEAARAQSIGQVHTVLRKFCCKPERWF